MIFTLQNMNLKTVRVVLTGDVNDIYICQDINTEADTLYTVLLIKKHHIAHKFLAAYEKSGHEMKDTCIAFFSQNEGFVVVFPYVKERMLTDFYMGDAYSLHECESICISLVVNCMTSVVPFPILKLILTQRRLHLSKDHSVYLDYQIDLTDLDVNCSETDSAVECAQIISELLSCKASENPQSYELIKMKIFRKNYSHFTELYKDIRIAAVPDKKVSIIKKAKAWFNRNKDTLFKILFAIALILGTFVLVSFVTQLIFGDIPWLRFFYNGFKIIGTEDLRQ